MKSEAIVKKLSEIPAGRFFRIRYITKTKQTAQSLKEGYTLFKIVDQTTRTGVRYASLVRSRDPDETDPMKREDNWEWVVKNRIKHNNKTGKDYVVIAPINLKKAHIKVTYVLTTPDGVTNTIDKEAAKQYVVESYFNRSSPVIQYITLDNVLLVK